MLKIAEMPEIPRLRFSESPTLQLKDAVPVLIVPPPPRVSVPVSQSVAPSGIVEVTLYDAVWLNPLMSGSGMVSVPVSVVVAASVSLLVTVYVRLPAEISPPLPSRSPKFWYVKFDDDPEPFTVAVPLGVLDVSL